MSNKKPLITKADPKKEWIGYRTSKDEPKWQALYEQMDAHLRRVDDTLYIEVDVETTTIAAARSAAGKYAKDNGYRIITRQFNDNGLHILRVAEKEDEPDDHDELVFNNKLTGEPDLDAWLDVVISENETSGKKKDKNVPPSYPIDEPDASTMVIFPPNKSVQVQINGNTVKQDWSWVYARLENFQVKDDAFFVTDDAYLLQMSVHTWKKSRGKEYDFKTSQAEYQGFSGLWIVRKS